MTKRKKNTEGQHHVPDELLIGQPGSGKGILPRSIEEPMKDVKHAPRTFVFDPKNDVFPKQQSQFMS